MEAIRIVDDDAERILATFYPNWSLQQWSAAHPDAENNGGCILVWRQDVRFPGIRAELLAACADSLVRTVGDHDYSAVLVHGTFERPRRHVLLRLAENPRGVQIPRTAGVATLPPSFSGTTADAMEQLLQYAPLFNL